MTDDCNLMITLRRILYIMKGVSTEDQTNFTVTFRPDLVLKSADLMNAGSASNYSTEHQGALDLDLHPDDFQFSRIPRNI